MHQSILYIWQAFTECCEVVNRIKDTPDIDRLEGIEVAFHNSYQVTKKVHHALRPQGSAEINQSIMERAVCS